MKRISISAIMLLVIAVCVAEARPVDDGFGFGYDYNRYRTRWSIYAHGLISGVVYYSPYVVGHGRTGLVEGYARYSPYAFGHGHSGLVEDYGGAYGVYSYGYAPGCYNVVHHYVPVSRSCKSTDTSHGYGKTNQLQAAKSRRETLEELKARRTAMAEARKKREAIRANDGKTIIAAYLKGNDIPFRTTRILSIEGRTVSVDFLLNDGKTIIKYWNPAEIPSKDTQHQLQRKFFERYVESWKVARDEHLEAGGSIYQVISSEREEILAKLPQLPDRNGNEKVYASAQGESKPAQKQ